MLVSLISTGFGKGGVEQLIFYTNLMDGGLQAWYERMPKEGIFWWQDDPVLAAEQNPEGHGAWSESFLLTILKMNIQVKTLGYDNEFIEVHVKHIWLYMSIYSPPKSC